MAGIRSGVAVVGRGSVRDGGEGLRLGREVGFTIHYPLEVEVSLHRRPEVLEDADQVAVARRTRLLAEGFEAIEQVFLQDAERPVFLMHPATQVFGHQHPSHRLGPGSWSGFAVVRLNHRSAGADMMRMDRGGGDEDPRECTGSPPLLPSSRPAHPEVEVPHDEPRRHAATILAALVGLALFGLLVTQAIARACSIDGSDLTSYLLSARALVEGRDPYATATPFPYIYPLFLAWLILPLAWLPCGVASALWSIALLASLIRALRWIGTAPWIAFGLCLLLFDVLQNNAVNGQVNLLVVLAATGGWIAIRRDRALLAAFGFGAAIALKVFPLLLLAPLVLRRKWRAAGGSVAVALALVSAPALLPGRDVIALHASYLDRFLLPRIEADPLRTGSVQFQLAGTLRDLGVAVDATGALTIALLLVVALAAWDLRRRSHEFDREVFALWMLLPALLIPISQVHHLAITLPAWIAAAETTFERRTRTDVALLALAIASYLVASLFWRDGPLYALALTLLSAHLVRRR